jgi:uncharacterized protein YjbI with pentapeptide repeats
MNDFEDNSDWEKLIALSDDELEAGMAKQSNYSQPQTQTTTEPIKDADNVTNPPAPESISIAEEDNDFDFDENFETVDQNWDYLLAQESTPSSEFGNEFEHEVIGKVTDEAENYPDWEKAVAIETPTPIEVIPDWQKLNQVKNTDPMTEGWGTASDEVNTEFMKEWEQSAARISALTGIELSGDDLSLDLTNEKPEVLESQSVEALIKVDNDLEKKPKNLPRTSSDESGPLPPLPVLPPKKYQAKKTIPKSDLQWFEKYHGDSAEIKTEKPTPNYHFDQLAEEICDNDQFNWTNLNQKAQSQPQPKSSPVWHPSKKIVIDLDDEPADSTAVWNYNPPVSFSETEAEVSAFKPKPSFDFVVSFKQLWQKFKIPMIAIATLGGLWGIYSIPFVQRGVTEMGLKSQLLKDASQKDLSGINFQDAKLEKVNFTNTSLKNANLKRANLTGASLNGANLRGANFSGANLRAVDLRNSKIELKGEQSTKLESKDLLMWRLINEPMQGRNLSRQNLDGFYLSGAMLKRANLIEAKLPWVNLSNANLVEAQLAGANLTGTNLIGANLTGADLSGVTWNKREPRTDSTTICPNGKKGPCKF